MPRGTPTTEPITRNKVQLEVERHQVDTELPPVWVTYVAHRDVWILVADYQVEIEWVDGLGQQCTADLLIPYGFEFDLASIPRPAWWLIAPFELSIIAPLVHDWLYVNNGDVNRRAKIGLRWINDFSLTRKQVDDVFLKLMEKEHITKWKRTLAYKAVRAFSWMFWDDNNH